MGILVKNSSFELLWGEPQPSIAFDNSTYSLAGEEDTTLSAQFSVLDNNNEDVTDKCIITFNNEYVTVEDGAFVCEGLEVGTYTTVVTAVYTYKSEPATVTANATINLTIESAQHDYSQDYLTFEALEDNMRFTCGANSVDYSIDNGQTWATLREYGTTPFLAQGDKVLWKSQNVVWYNKKITSSGRFNAYGNIMSLLYGDNFVNQTTFPSGYTFGSGVFKDNQKLISAENLILPATTLANNCYEYMFNGCTSLTTAPSTLPATTLASACYNSMFQDCTSLTTAPVLPATTLASACYQYMFSNCTNLNSITMLATDISASNCLNTWVRNVASSGTFTKAAAMTTLPSGASGIPANWTVVDAS